MIHEITIANEERLVAQWRAHLQSEARRVIADHPGRVGKFYAQVTFPKTSFMSLYLPGSLDEFKVDFV